MPNLALPFLTGLTMGFSHCIGMCGIFILSTASVSQPDITRHRYLRALFRQAMFQGGRLLSLSVLGAIAGVIGSLAAFRTHIPSAQAYLSIVAGTILAIVSLAPLGVAPRLRLPEPDVLGAGGGRLRTLYAKVMRSGNTLKPIALGVLVGLLPCGLIYEMLIYSLTSPTPAHGAMTMFAFGLGTVPGLVALGLLAESVPWLVRSQAWRVGMTRLSGIILLVMAWSLVSRGIETLRALRP